MTNPITLEEVQRALPANLKSAATDNLVNLINGVTTDPEMAEQIKGNFLSYVGVLREGRFKTEDYLNAVTYVSYKLMGDSNQDAYFKTFPVRHANLLAKQTSAKDISAYVSAYNKNKLVNMIYENTLVPSWVLNQDLYQKALNVQADLMITAVSEKVRTDAANSLLTHLGKPKEGGFQLNLDVKETSGLTEIKGMLEQLAQSQLTAIGKGMTTREVAAQPLIEGVSKEVTK